LLVKSQGDKMRYALFDNDKPASREGFPDLKSECWKTHIFDTEHEAQMYANNWLGYPGPHYTLRVGLKYDYSGYGDMLLLKEIPDA